MKFPHLKARLEKKVVCWYLQLQMLKETDKRFKIMAHRMRNEENDTDILK